MAAEYYNIDEIVAGKNVGIFRITSIMADGVMLKEVNPVTLVDGYHPELFHSFDMIKKLTLPDLWDAEVKS